MYDRNKPLLRLNPPIAAERRKGSGRGTGGRKYTQSNQRNRLGPKFKTLQTALERGNLMELRTDPSALAPERLLVFETTGNIGNFHKAVRNVSGLEFVGEEEVLGDEKDENPEHYLLMPNEAALKQLLSLWARWLKDQKMDRGFTPWREVFSQLRDIRPWGPSDRVSSENRKILQDQISGMNPDELLRFEIDLVFRVNEETANKSETEIIEQIKTAGGNAISISRRVEFSYHAILVDLPIGAIEQIVTLNPNSLAGSDPVAFIIPQSTFEAGGVETDTHPDSASINYELPPEGTPVIAVFDAVPIQAHPILSGGIIVDDPSGLEARAVGNRSHGTAMASLVLHGDLKGPLRPVQRPIYFRPVMYAPVYGGECFDENKLVVDVICEAVETMHQNGGENIVAINISLGDIYRPFQGRISTWARALDYLSFRYGVLFLVSAGNDRSNINLTEIKDNQEFNECTEDEKSNIIIESFNNDKADRKILSPAESINSLTIGAWHRDANTAPHPSSSLLVPHQGKEMPNLSSRVGLGVSNAVKPDALFEGGREHAQLGMVSPPVTIRPHTMATRFAGVCVAAQPQGTRNYSYQLGSSSATAIATHTAGRLHDLMESEYPDQFLPLSKAKKAALIKALLIHSASWRGRGEEIRAIIDPSKDMDWRVWRAEISRLLGYGFVEPDEAVYCAANRATLWSTGELLIDEAKEYKISLPTEIGTLAGVREVRATLAWFSPTRPRHMTYRASKLRITALGNSDFSVLGVSTFSDEPGHTQIERGTISHRRWRNNRMGHFDGDTEFSISIQRDKDQGVKIDDAIPYGLAVTIEHEKGTKIYEEILTSVHVRPRSLIPVRT